MEILRELYFGNVNENERRPTPMQKHRNSKDAEEQAYDQFKANVNKKQFALFEKYIDLYEDRIELIYEDKYIQGFKTGFKIALESIDIKL